MSTGNREEIDTAAIATWSRQASDGDLGALEKLLWAHQSRLAGFIRRKVGVDWQGKIDPEDVLQEAFIDIFKGIGAFSARDDESFYRWATRIIDHRFIDQVRRLRRAKRDVSREIGDREQIRTRQMTLLEKCVAKDKSPSVAMRRADAINALMTCMSRLPEDYRTVIRRLYLNEEPLSVIAAEMGRSEDAVRRLGSRAVERLARCVGRASRYFSSHD